MAYDNILDARITCAIADQGATHKKISGTCHMLDGNMPCGVYENFLILRLEENAAQQALERRARSRSGQFCRMAQMRP